MQTILSLIQLLWIEYTRIEFLVQYFVINSNGQHDWLKILIKTKYTINLKIKNLNKNKKLSIGCRLIFENNLRL